MASQSALVFAAIFPQSTVAHTTPTPQATPDLSFVAPGQPFGGPSTRRAKDHGNAPLTAAQQAVQRNIAWSTATQFLSLQGAPVPGGQARHGAVTRSSEVQEALQLLLAEREGAPPARNELVEWYEEEARQHFDGVARGALQRPTSLASPGQAWDFLTDTAMKLGALSDMYLLPMRNHIAPEWAENAPPSLGEESSHDPFDLTQDFERKLHSMFAHSTNRKLLGAALALTFRDTGRRLFQLDDGAFGSGSVASAAASDDPVKAFGLLKSLLRALSRIGLAGDDAQRAFARAIDCLIDDFVDSWHVRVDWYGKSSVMPKLRRWVDEGLARYISEVMACLSDSTSSPQPQTPAAAVQDEQVRQWRDMATMRLGRARVSNLFDYVIRWDRSLGALLDLKEYIGTPGARMHLASAFAQQLQRRLLHAGATTIQILDAYIYVIRAFGELDAKGVLLDRVARPIRRYLKERDDTIRVIIASLLADVAEGTGDAEARRDVSIEVGKEMLGPVAAATAPEQDQDIDWGNMAWTPEPHDASPEYKRSRSEDVLSSLLSLYDKEDFTAELKNILGAHLIRVTTAAPPRAEDGDGGDNDNENDDDAALEKEIRLLELFKTRLGDDKLQACEVMLHDVDESRHMDRSIQQDSEYERVRQEVSSQQQNTTDSGLALGAQILSSFFWPPLRDDSFAVPAPVARLQSAYGAGFAALKDMRTLKWLHGLGRVDVELQLRDRAVALECSTGQASVIYAFGDDDGDDDDAADAAAATPKRRTVAQLLDALQMDEALLRQCLAFWQSQRVLREVPGQADAFEVLETLSDVGGTGSSGNNNNAAAAAAAAAAVKSPADVLVDNMHVYRQFIVGMLTNQGRMDAARMHAMLRMVVPGGFPFAVGELARLLERMAGDGLVRGEGDGWVVVR